MLKTKRVEYLRYLQTRSLFVRSPILLPSCVRISRKKKKRERNNNDMQSSRGAGAEAKSLDKAARGGRALVRAYRAHAGGARYRRLLSFFFFLLSRLLAARDTREGWRGPPVNTQLIGERGSGE